MSREFSRNRIPWILRETKHPCLHLKQSNGDSNVQLVDEVLIEKMSGNNGEVCLTCALFQSLIFRLFLQTDLD